MNSPKPNIRASFYRYNAHTCRYEHCTRSWINVVLYASGVVITGAFIMTGLLFLHDYMVDSEKEIALKKENSAIRTTEITLTRQLAGIEATLVQLDRRDRELHTKFFASAEGYIQSRSEGENLRKILLSDALQFHNYAETLKTRLADLMSASSNPNNNYTEKINLRFYRSFLASVPSLSPVKKMNAQNLVSGFGMRINPFHKGLYKHDGIDIATPRGTEVVSAANGKVIAAKFSSVHAGYGNYLEIDHGNGFISRYTHLEDIHVRAGSEVLKGQVIAVTGNSGGTIAPHLHYEILRNGKNVDPISYMICGVSPEQHETLRRAGRVQNQSLD